MERTISWTMPSTYQDGTPMAGGEVPRIKVHVWRDGQEVYVTLPGVTEWPIEVGNPGTTSVWELTAELDGQVSPKSPAFTHVEPFLVPAPPAITRVA